MLRNARNRRIQREAFTIEMMIRLYCRKKHRPQGGLCSDCQELADYAQRRLEKCPFQTEKPTCANCRVHCYRAEMRARIREVMRYSGPRMLLYHPVLAVLHQIDGRRPTPAQREKNPKRDPDRPD